MKENDKYLILHMYIDTENRQEIVFKTNRVIFICKKTTTKNKTGNQSDSTTIQPLKKRNTNK